jgi:hypothetical protein
MIASSPLSSSSPYANMISKKRPWSAVEIEAGAIKDGAKDALQRCLALRCLELPVAELLEQGMAKELPSTPGIIEALLSNQKDEERHDEALNYAAQAHGTNEKAEKEVQNILKAWMDHPAHPILKAAILERSIFFVVLPFFRFNGDMGLRTISQDISRDEQVHVGVNSLLAKELGENASQSLNRLRRATALWAFDDLGNSDDKWLDKDFWLRQSDQLFERGKAEELVESRRGRAVAFFEGPATSLPMYS